MPCAPVRCEDQGGEEEEIIAEDVDVEPLKVSPSPVKPDAATVGEHKITHIPYRSWCRECVEGRALGEQRGHAHDTQPKTIAVVGADYFFITAKGVFQKMAEAKEDMDIESDEEFETARREGKVVKCILVRCSNAKLIFAHVVPCKGVDEDGHVVKLVCDNLAWMGHTRIILKCDNEPAVKKVITEALIRMKVDVKELETISQEFPEKYESQSNGMTEVGVKIFRGHFRTLRSCMQRSLGAEIPVDHPIMAWIVSHTCLLINAMVRGEDGLTAWARARGRPFRQRLIGFAESCLYKLHIKGPQHDVDGNMAPRWKVGTFIGYNHEANSYIPWKEGVGSPLLEPC